MKHSILLIFSLFTVTVFSCKKKTDPVTPVNTSNPEPQLIFKFKFDSTQVRLDNLGQPSTIPSGHAAQCPVFHSMSAHYIELSPNDNTALGGGAVLYRAPETTAGGSNAIDFSQAKLAGQNEVFFSIPLKNVAAGSYKWLRVSLAYQNYDIKYKYYYTPTSTDYYFTGTLASFIGFDTYITSYKINTQTMAINGNKLQGYWGFETSPLGVTSTYEGQTSVTTVPNPLNSSSPIPAGSCVVTGQFANNLVITGNETKDVTVVVSLSTNNSFEWNDTSNDGWYQPNAPANETVVDMGIRGLIPTVQ
ncbi:MAG TPA: hypothetical protein VNB90_01225 [Cytophagaceae bacterium]|nr:hypothetical protein [Cytophagaceae bacterium]